MTSCEQVRLTRLLKLSCKGDPPNGQSFQPLNKDWSVGHDQEQKCEGLPSPCNGNDLPSYQGLGRPLPEGLGKLTNQFFRGILKLCPTCRWFACMDLRASRSNHRQLYIKETVQCEHVCLDCMVCSHILIQACSVC